MLGPSIKQKRLDLSSGIVSISFYKLLTEQLADKLLQSQEKGTEVITRTAAFFGEQQKLTSQSLWSPTKRLSARFVKDTMQKESPSAHVD